MHRYRMVVAAILTGGALLAAGASAGERKDEGRNEHRKEESRYAVTRLVADDAALGAKVVDKNLVNAWGIAATRTSFWWVADNGTGVSTLYDGDGNPQPLVVSVRGAGGAPAAPTGIVANEGARFVISEGGASKPAVFIFASEDGTISGWNAAVPPGPPTPATHTLVEIDHSATAIYKGLAISPGGDRLFATNFHAGTVEVFDGDWNEITSKHAFEDRDLPRGYAPFGIRVIGVHVFVTYALQDQAKEDDVRGPGHGFVDEFTLDGRLVRRVASRGKLNSPWGLALAPDGFGSASGQLLVGNFGDGHLIAFDFDDCGCGDRNRGDDHGDSHRDRTCDDGDRGDYLEDANGPVVIDGLWGIGFGNGNRSGPANVLYFAAGPNDEANGLFGRIDLVSAGTP